MWHFVTKHQPTDLFFFCLRSDGSVFDDLIIGFQVLKKKKNLFSSSSFIER